jgi:hypothetical protein
VVFVYIVRCNFTEPAKEQAWNDWYSGPKIEQMLRNPDFRTCQRFRRAAGRGRDYLALWTLQSPEALKSPQYLAQWGFSDWTPLITDWSRDLFDGGDAAEADFAVTPQGALLVVAFDGMSADDAAAARAAVAKSEPELLWLPVAALDRHTPMIGLRPLSDAGALPRLDNRPAERMQQAVYRPISPCYAAGPAAA